MKKIILSLITLVSLCGYAQEKSLIVGITGGANATFFRGNSDIRANEKPGIGSTSGIFLQYGITPKFSLRTEAIFDRKIAVNEITFTDESGNPTRQKNIKKQLSYMTIPVLFKAHFGEKIRAFVNAGPYVSFLSDAKYLSDADYLGDISNLYQKNDFGMIAGLGIAGNNEGRIGWSVEARNSLGLKTIATGQNELFHDMKLKTLSLLLSLNYNFSKGA
jgi:hypothetical protein